MIITWNCSAIRRPFPVPITKLILYSKSQCQTAGICQEVQYKVICSNDVHFVDEENAEAHDRLICLSTGKDLDDPSRMLYTKQEWMKTKAEMNELLPMFLKRFPIRWRFWTRWNTTP